MADRKSAKRDSQAKKMLETIAASIGGLLAVATLSVVIWDAATNEGKPPFVTVQAVETQQVNRGFLLKVLAVNSGDETVTSVPVEGVLTREGATVETSETVLDFVPRRSSTRGGLFFTMDPRLHKVTLRATGYADP